MMEKVEIVLWNEFNDIQRVLTRKSLQTNISLSNNSLHHPTSKIKLPDICDKNIFVCVNNLHQIFAQWKR